MRATVYLQLQPEYAGGNWMRDTPASVRGAKVVGSTQKRSSQPKPGTVEVKITIEIPKGVFLPLRPEAIVVIPDGFITPHPITVEAVDPNESENN